MSTIVNECVNELPENVKSEISEFLDNLITDGSSPGVSKYNFEGNKKVVIETHGKIRI